MRVCVGSLLVMALFVAPAGVWAAQNDADAAPPHSTGNADVSAKPEPGIQQEAKQAVYTCPMHPDVRQEEPGKCPICGMDLLEAVEPEDDASTSDASEQEGSPAEASEPAADGQPR